VITAGDATTALVAALEAWRTTRAPALADLIDTISTKIATPSIASDLEWTKTAAPHDPATLGRLLEVIRALPVSFLPTVAQSLARFPDDPRITSAAADWIVDPPTQSSSTYPFWTQLYTLLVRIGDTRVIAAIDERVALPMEASKQFPKARTKTPSQFWGKFYAALEKTRDKLAALPAATVNKAAIARLAGKLEVTAAKPGKIVADGGECPRKPRATPCCGCP
jgi:hypothetical protein